MQWLWAALLVGGAYLFGSVPTGYWLCRWVAGIDVRTVGSKNIGATNVARSLGRKWGLVVLMIDIAKGALPVIVAQCLWPAQVQENILKITLVALAAFLGHLVSLFLRFRGGKGVATALGISFALVPKAAFPALAVFLFVTLGWRYVSLGSITAALTLPIWTAITKYPPGYVALSSIFAVCIVISHRENIRALWQRKERRF